VGTSENQPDMRPDSMEIQDLSSTMIFSGIQSINLSFFITQKKSPFNTEVEGAQGNRMDLSHRYRNRYRDAIETF